MTREYADYAWEQTSALLAIDSPSGYTAAAAEWVRAAFAALGFVSYHGMTAEQLAWAWFRSEILEPKRLVSEPDNLYYKLLEDTISKHEKEEYKA